MKIVVLWILMLFQLANSIKCQQSGPIEKEIYKYFHKRYSNVNKSITRDLDSLKNNIFCGNNFILESSYIFNSGINNNNGNLYCKLNIYNYSDRKTPLSIISKIDSIKQKKKKEGIYGPFSKNFNLFLSTDNLLIHIEKPCEISYEEWNSMRIDLGNILRKYSRNESRSINKICED